MLEKRLFKMLIRKADLEIVFMYNIMYNSDLRINIASRKFK